MQRLLPVSLEPEALQTQVKHSTMALLRIYLSGHQIRVVLEIYYLYFLSKTYVVGTQKNRLNEMVLLSTQNIYLN